MTFEIKLNDSGLALERRNFNDCNLFANVSIDNSGEITLLSAFGYISFLDSWVDVTYIVKSNPRLYGNVMLTAGGQHGTT